MPRSNRPRGRGARTDEQTDLSRVLIGRLGTEEKRDGAWNVQPIAAASSTKTYLCPACGLDISPGTAHLTTWRADGLMGDADAIADRRHWHTHCWRIRR
jgi:hypothetical protein